MYICAFVVSPSEFRKFKCVAIEQLTHNTYKVPLCFFLDFFKHDYIYSVYLSLYPSPYPSPSPSSSSSAAVSVILVVALLASFYALLASRAFTRACCPLSLGPQSTAIRWDGSLVFFFMLSCIAHVFPPECYFF